MSLATIMEEEARLVILRTLAEQPDRRLNSSLLQTDLSDRWGINRSRDWVHMQLGFLAHEVGALRLTEMGSVWIAELSARGLDHAERRIVLPGVKRPSPPEN
ncbi:VpaChn25_0724 family phage protein [Rhodoblastus sp.]|uniref:VpaChn25_0724 family phage protein n=1 Tax=Rhodoblastus sp. TaxID=1962975 RepID=UPI003F9BC72B